MAFVFPTATTTYRTQSPASEILVGTVDGVTILRRNMDDTWRVHAKVLAGLHIHALLIEPLSGVIFAGAHKGSIHASKDGGATWEKKDQGLTAADIYCLSSAVIDGKTKLFAGTEPAHLFASDDSAENWQESKSLRSVTQCSEMDFPRHPSRPGRHRIQSTTAATSTYVSNRAVS